MTPKEKAQEIADWLVKNGWARDRRLPDYAAANIKHWNGFSEPEGPSFADMVYDLLDSLLDEPICQPKKAL